MNTSKRSIVTTVVVLWLGHFFVDMMLGVWPVYKTLAHLDLAKVGLLGGACATIGEGLQIIFGLYSDRGYRTIILLAGLLATITSVFFVFTSDYFSLFILYLITTLGSGAFHPAATSAMSDLPSQRKGLFLALFAMGGSLGMAFSQIIFTHALDSHIFLLAVPAVLLFVFAVTTRAIKQPLVESEQTSHFDASLFLQFFRHKHLRALYFIQLCNATLLWGTLFLLPDLLSTRGYEPWLSFGWGHMVMILGGSIMMIPAGYLADRFSSRIVILTSTIASMVLFYMLLIFPLLSDTTILTILFFLGASLVIVNPVSIALGIKLVPTHKGMVSAFLMGLVWCVSEMLGQGGGGLLTKLFEVDAPAKALAILGSLFLLGTMLAAQLPQKEIEGIELEMIT